MKPNRPQRTFHTKVSPLEFHMLSHTILMTSVIEKYRQRLLELRLDVERVQVYILENASASELLTTQREVTQRPTKKRLEMAVLQ
jgi:hypothetical protein